MRDRLIELLSKPIFPKIGVDPAEVVADYLLDNGVIVPPCKVGDRVWFDTWKRNGTVNVGIQPHSVDSIIVVLMCDEKSHVLTEIRDYQIGKSVFLTKEEAEKALKEREGK